MVTVAISLSVGAITERRVPCQGSRRTEKPPKFQSQYREYSICMLYINLLLKCGSILIGLGQIL